MVAVWAVMSALPWVVVVVTGLIAAVLAAAWSE